MNNKTRNIFVLLFAFVFLIAGSIFINSKTTKAITDNDNITNIIEKSTKGGTSQSVVSTRGKELFSAIDMTSDVILKQYDVQSTTGASTTEFLEGEWARVELLLDIHFPDGYKAGDYFTVPFPDSAHFNFEQTGQMPQTDPLITYKVENGVLICTLTEEGAGFDGLYDLHLTLGGTAKKEGTNINGGGKGDITLEIKPAPEPSIPENSDKPFPDEFKELFKNGRQQGLDDVITWSGRVNYQDLDQLFIQGDTTNKIQDKNGMMLVDHLTPGTTFVPNSLIITIPIYVNTTKNEMGDRQIGAGVDASGKPQTLIFGDIEYHSSRVDSFKLLEQGSMTYDEFYDYVQTYPENNNGEQAYGVYTHDTGLQTVLVSFGTLPGNTFKYEDLRKDFGAPYGELDIFSCIQRDVTLTEAQKEYLKKIYSSDGPSSGHITAYNYAFSVNVDTPEYSSGTYYNDISLVDKDDYKEETSGEAIFNDKNSGINAYGFKMTKTVTGSGKLKDPETFVFEIRDNAGSVVAYGKTENAITDRGVAEKVKFYSDNGYVDEIKTYNDWKAVLKANQTHTIHEVGTNDYEVVFKKEHSGEVSNVFEYNPNVQQVWSFVVENTLETINVEGTKTWNDNSDQDGKRPAKITVNLYADGVKIDSVEVSATDNWEYSFTDLPKMQNGVEINYTIKEEAVPEYTTTITDYDITNTHVPEKTKVEGTKTWDDNSNQDGKRPAKITVDLYADGTKVDSKEVSATDNWSYSFTGLDKYKNGQEITYTIKEEAVPGYTTTITGHDITNTHVPEKIKVEGTKTWNDGNNQDGKRPAKITVDLYADGTKIDSKEVSATDNWEYSFTGLDKYKNGQEIEYTIKEETVPGYTTTITGHDITNIHVPEKIKVEGTKTWNDNSDQDGKRPAKITVDLYADGTKVDSKEVSANDNWSYSFTNLDKYQNGQEITYTIKEEAVPEYTTTITGHDITNTHVPEKIKVEGSKTWDDANNQDGKRPAKITVNLHADGTKIDSKEVSATDNWEYSFTGLDKYKNGQEIVYTVSEDSIPEYSTVVTDHNITNSYTPGKTSVTITKAWDDASNQDGKRPTSIEVQLYADGVAKGSEVELNSTNSWTHTWSNLDEKASGVDIVYTVEETSVPPGYTVSVDNSNAGSIIITNSYTPEKTKVEGTKTWNDGNNQDGKRPAKITVDLYADGTKVDSKEVSANDNWSYSFTNLDKYQNGQEITYTIKEEAVPEYTTTITGHDITNSYTPELVSVNGTKTWDDANNQDGKRPAKITVNLYADGTKIDSKEVSATDNWEYSFTGLDKYKNGQEIEYTIKEDSVPEYTTTIEGFNITNSYTPEVTTKSVKKVWDDANNQDGKRPSKIEVQLYADNIVHGSVVELNQGNGWSYTWTALDKKANGTDIVYTVQEVNVPTDYTVVVNDSTTALNTVEIVNTYTPETTKVEGKKIWNDSNNQDGKRPNKVTINLHADGIKIDSKQVSANDNWEYSFTGLDKYKNGQEINYTVTEDTVLDYNTVINGLDITNNYTPEQTSVTVTKAWDDANNQDGKRPASIQVQLYADNNASGSSIVLDSSNSWTYTWNNLNKKAAGVDIVYTVQELGVPNGYTSVVDDSNPGSIVITNVYIPEKININGIKTWKDNNNEDKQRPNKITINLLADGVKVASKEVSANDGWAYTFNNLPKYKNGQEIIYRISEDKIPNYQSEITGFDVENTYIPIVIDVKGSKVWEDNNNATKQRPRTITINLLADGKQVATKEVSAKDNWSYQFSNLPKFNKGKEIKYTITEDGVLNYKTEIDGFNVKNILIPNDIVDAGSAESFIALCLLITSISGLIVFKRTKHC